MALKVYLKGQEGSTLHFVVDFYLTKEDGSRIPTIPNDDLLWTLYDKDGQVVNNRVNQPVGAQTSIVITLSGDDLNLPYDYPAKRILTIRGSYNSLFGMNLPLLEEISFQIENLVGV